MMGDPVDVLITPGRYSPMLEPRGSSPTEWLPARSTPTASTGCNGAQTGCRERRAAPYVEGHTLKSAICRTCTAVLMYPGGDLPSTVGISTAEAAADRQRDLVGRRRVERANRPDSTGNSLAVGDLRSRDA